jgi:2-iminobutanoate/2-iminopropanoate deaminase
LREENELKRTVAVEEKGEPTMPLSHAIVARGFVFVSGQGPIDRRTKAIPGDFEEQVRLTLDNMRLVLEASGAGLGDVVKVNAYLTDMTRFPKFNQVYREYFPEDPPARTTVGANMPNILVEMDCVAVLPEAG